MLSQIVDGYHRTSLLEREAIFDTAKLMPITQTDDASTAAPGWVGPSWKAGGTVLMAINPGGGGDNYRLNSADEQLYGLIRRFKFASPVERKEALLALSDAWVKIQMTHNIYRIIRPILEALSADNDDVAFLNVLPFRTRNDAPAGSANLRRAWDVATRHQVEALKPKRIIALGRKAFDALTAAGATRQYDVIYIKRAIGDSYITLEAQATIQALRESQ